MERVPGGDRGVREDEMRPITALFADIVGSTSLGERLAPDEVKALVGECVGRMAQSVEAFGGVIQAYQGDGICAYFGVPAAHEDDPERAARAALRIVAVVGEYAREVESAWGIADFNVRVGVNSGPAAVGVVGAGDPQAVALGDATNVAARLESAAAPGTVLVGGSTARRLPGGFTLEPAGELTVKGRNEPVEVSRLVDVTTGEGSQHPTVLPLVGRDEELAKIRSVVQDAAAGRGRALMIVGERGMGKTRLLAELRDLAGDRVTWVEGRCSPYGAERAYGPFAEALRGWLGASEGDAPIAVRTKLRARLASVAGREELPGLVAALGRMIGVAIHAEEPDPHEMLSPQEAAAEVRSGFARWLEALAATRSVILAIDDLDHADASSVALAEQLLPVSDRAAVVLAMTTTLGSDRPGWSFRSRALGEFGHRSTELTLAPLSQEASGALLGHLVPPGLMARVTRDEVVARAEGNPLFLQELARALVEGTDRRRTWTVAPATSADLPPAVEGLLIARIDRLSEDSRMIAQAAAVIGRTFPVPVLAAVLERPDLDLTPLLRADVIREVRRFPELECAFSHGLLHEAALATLTPKALRSLSGRVATVLEGRYADDPEAHAEVLAFHLYRSDDARRAIPYLEVAAERALAEGDVDRAASLRERMRKAASAGDPSAPAM